ncbi:YHYH domain-containing protein, partial [Priestia megaterium]|uniref:YHYH domain-containing protein n=1 Tax=Priestia megaterium TaxID=1404 RepID=UPI00300A83A4
MRKCFVVLLTLIFLMESSYIVSAHPGRTDGNGGHYCRTNCEKWGYEYGEYHYHNGSSSNVTSDDVETEIQTDTETSQEDLEEIYDQLSKEGYEIGYQDGYNQRSYEEFHEEKYSVLSNAEYSWYKKGYDEGFSTGKERKNAEVSKQQEEEFNEGKEAGASKAHNDFKNGNIQISSSSNKDKSNSWNEGFSQAYEKTVVSLKLTDEAYKEGYDQGESQQTMKIKNSYLNNSDASKAFESGFKEAKKKEYKQKGFQQALSQGGDNLPSYISHIYISSFKKGYKEGKKEITSLKKDAYAAGKSGNKFVVPDKYKTKNIEEVTQATYKKGQDE